ncbi:MAG: HAD-IC family P-type ATPase [Lachnospiraceae bacterium]|nr:HAD-IC family P-type ATPase [Lachnospiraceae bacterium]
MKNPIRSTKQIIAAHTFTYFNLINLILFSLILLSGQQKNMLFMGVVLTNTVIGIIQELKVKKIIDSLSVITATKVFRITEGKHEQIPIEELKAADKILVQTGDQLAADGIVLTSQGLEVNEALLTGEADVVLKKPGDTLFSGTFVVAGEGTARIEKAGDDCYAAKLAQKAKTKKRATSEMQNAIRRIIWVVSFAIIPVGIGLFLSQRLIGKLSVSDAIVKTVAGVIGMIPEGLVLLTSVSFILGVGRLAKKKALVQEMEAIEALARVNVLCLDKTGTITTGKLSVENSIPLSSHTQAEITRVMKAFSHAFPNTNATGEALSRYFGCSSEDTVTDCLPFSSSRKCMGITLNHDKSYLVGAPDFLIQKSRETSALFCRIENYFAKGYRVLLLASCTSLHETERQPGTQPMSNQVIPVGLILLTDCIREDAAETFTFFGERNVDIKVISGDNPVTVSQIAVRAGLQGGERYIDARKLPDDIHALSEIVDNYTVFGRVSPEQKQLLIKAFQKNGKVTGMVGDGVNDVLAIKDADCGIAMAAGSIAAKQSAHIVLLDSDFASMKSIVKEGRTIIANIERVSALYLTKTIYSVLLCIIFICLRRAYPFIPIQLSLISATAIGIPSFFLTLEQHETVTTTGFLRHVLRISLPCALLLVGSLIAVQILKPIFALPALVVSTLNLIIGGGISIAIVFLICRPMTKKRFVLCMLITLLFCIGILFFPDFFGIKEII